MKFKVHLRKNYACIRVWYNQSNAMLVLKRTVDTILFFCFCFLAGTGLMMKFSFVKGLGPQSVLGLTKHDWETLHLYVGILMLVAVILHLISNRVWIVKVGAKNNRWIALLVIAIGIITVLTLTLAPTTLAVK